MKHTTLYLTIFIFRGKKIYEPPRFMTIGQCIEQLLEVESIRNENGSTHFHFIPTTQITAVFFVSLWCEYLLRWVGKSWKRRSTGDLWQNGGISKNRFWRSTPLICHSRQNAWNWAGIFKFYCNQEIKEFFFFFPSKKFKYFLFFLARNKKKEKEGRGCRCHFQNWKKITKTKKRMKRGMCQTPNQFLQPRLQKNERVKKMLLLPWAQRNKRFKIKCKP